MCYFIGSCNWLQVKATIDGKEFIEQMQHDFSLIEPHLIYLAGSNDAYQLTNHHIFNNFVGTISEVRYCRYSGLYLLIYLFSLTDNNNFIIYLTNF